ncbi:MAG: DUF134 domain-containing protein [Spirochaetes bacterium]|nr:DUF134 domain-containing protein [Spirochaetota bacterium]
MSRPKCCRKIGCMPENSIFIPQGCESNSYNEIILSLDEFEALKLADFKKMYQQEAAAAMGVSRQTFGRIIESAHYKIADALLNAKIIRIKGGEVISADGSHSGCTECISSNASTGKSEFPSDCPKKLHREVVI